jgi:hypothetical protein
MSESAGVAGRGLEITKGAVEAVVFEIITWGTEICETGAFMLSSEASPDRMATVALPGLAGVHRAHDGFKLSGAAIERLFTWAADSGFRIRAQMHSHRRHAFLSPTDLRYGFNVEGFITSVVPDYAAPPHDPADWGWWRYQRQGWDTARSPTVIDGGCTTVLFDERRPHVR